MMDRSADEAAHCSNYCAMLNSSSSPSPASSSTCSTMSSSTVAAKNNNTYFMHSQATTKSVTASSSRLFDDMDRRVFKSRFVNETLLESLDFDDARQQQHSSSALSSGNPAPKANNNFSSSSKMIPPPIIPPRSTLLASGKTKAPTSRSTDGEEEDGGVEEAIAMISNNNNNNVDDNKINDSLQGYRDFYESLGPQHDQSAARESATTPTAAALEEFYSSTNAAAANMMMDDFEPFTESIVATPNSSKSGASSNNKYSMSAFNNSFGSANSGTTINNNNNSNNNNGNELLLQQENIGDTPTSKISSLTNNCTTNRKGSADSISTSNRPRAEEHQPMPRQRTNSLQPLLEHQKQEQNFDIRSEQKFSTSAAGNKMESSAKNSKINDFHRHRLSMHEEYADITEEDCRGPSESDDSALPNSDSVPGSSLSPTSNSSCGDSGMTGMASCYSTNNMNGTELCPSRTQAAAILSNRLSFLPPAPNKQTKGQNNPKKFQQVAHGVWIKISENGEEGGAAGEKHNNRGAAYYVRKNSSPIMPSSTSPNKKFSPVSSFATESCSNISRNSSNSELYLCSRPAFERKLSHDSPSAHHSQRSSPTSLSRKESPSFSTSTTSATASALPPLPTVPKPTSTLDFSRFSSDKVIGRNVRPFVKNSDDSSEGSDNETATAAKASKAHATIAKQPAPVEFFKKQETLKSDDFVRAKPLPSPTAFNNTFASRENGKIIVKEEVEEENLDTFGRTLSTDEKHRKFNGDGSYQAKNDNYDGGFSDLRCEEQYDYTPSPDEIEQIRRVLGVEFEDHEIVSTVLRRPPTITKGSVGLLLNGGSLGSDFISISKVVSGSIAQMDGKLCEQDRVFFIQSTFVEKMKASEAREILKAEGATVSLIVGRRKSSSLLNNTSNSLGTSRILSSTLSNKFSSTSSLLTNSDDIFTGDPADEVYSDVPIFVTLKKTDDLAGIGLSFEGGKSSAFGKRPIVVKKVFAGGVAAKDGRIGIGDEIRSINDEDVSNVSKFDVGKIIKKCPIGPVELVIFKRLTLDDD